MLEWVMRQISRAPSWLQPPIAGALLLLALVGGRMLFAIPQLRADPEQIPHFALGLLAATAAGAVGGLGYSLLGVRLRQQRPWGPCLAGIATMGGYLGTLWVAAPYIEDDPMFHGWVAFAVIVAVSIFGGMWFGRVAFKD
jgi:hypothetical protein